MSTNTLRGHYYSHCLGIKSWKETKAADSFEPSPAKMKDPSRINSELIQHGQFINDDNPFAEYMWMENEEEFNRQIEEELWEEEFIEQCFQEMLEEEENEWFIPARDLPPTLGQLQDQLNLLVLCDTGIVDGLVINSNLNPEAQEFVPGLKH